MNEFHHVFTTWRLLIQWWETVRSTVYRDTELSETGLVHRVRAVSFHESSQHVESSSSLLTNREITIILYLMNNPQELGVLTRYSEPNIVPIFQNQSRPALIGLIGMHAMRTEHLG